MREKASFKVGVVAVAVLIVAATFLVPNPEGLAFEGRCSSPARGRHRPVDHRWPYPS